MKILYRPSANLKLDDMERLASACGINSFPETIEIIDLIVTVINEASAQGLTIRGAMFSRGYTEIQETIRQRFFFSDHEASRVKECNIKDAIKTMVELGFIKFASDRGVVVLMLADHLNYLLSEGVR